MKKHEEHMKRERRISRRIASWEDYERHKAMIKYRGLTPEKYQEEMQRIVRYLGL